MRIRRHLFFYNTISVLVALVAMLAVNGAATHAIGRYYQKQAEQVLQNLPDSQRPKDGMILVERGNGKYDMVGMSPPPRLELLGRPRRQSEAMMLSLLLSGVTAIVVIVLLNLLFTRYQVRKLLQPVDTLTQAARRVEAGDFTQPVEYRGKDEFSSVCAAFNQMQEHLLAERERGAAYERARTNLVAGISHDLRTPLTSVKGYIKGLRDGVAQTPERQRQYLDIAYRKACSMDVLLQRLFYFSKLETGNLPLFLEQTDLGEFVERFQAEAQEELEQAGGQIKLAVASGGHPVSIDREQLYRVLGNLKDNALRYAEASPLILTVVVERRDDGEHILFSDNGKGVPEETLPHLFEQFWREDRARGAKDGEGTGLGLYIVKCVVEAHGGTIQVKNDRGLAFDIRLPRSKEGDHDPVIDCGG